MPRKTIRRSQVRRVVFPAQMCALTAAQAANAWQPTESNNETLFIALQFAQAVVIIHNYSSLMQ